MENVDLGQVLTLLKENSSLILGILLLIYYGRASYYKAAYTTLKAEFDEGGWEDEAMYWRSKFDRGSAS